MVRKSEGARRGKGNGAALSSASHFRPSIALVGCAWRRQSHASNREDPLLLGLLLRWNKVGLFCLGAMLSVTVSLDHKMRGHTDFLLCGRTGLLGEGGSGRGARGASNQFSVGQIKKWGFVTCSQGQPPPPKRRLLLSLTDM